MKTYMKKAFLMLICLMAGWANGVGAKVTDDESAIRLDSMQVSGNMLAGMTQQATVNMSNIGSDDYEGYWYLFEQASPTEPKVLLSGTSVKAAAGRTATVRLKFELTEGAHTLLLAADGKGEQLLASAQVAMHSSQMKMPSGPAIMAPTSCGRLPQNEHSTTSLPVWWRQDIRVCPSMPKPPTT